ncbi:MAG: hypothetical protein J7530_20925 [Novosphingobium sp.]|nr:hypothetical protein [Novosphingobium sp.]
MQLNGNTGSLSLAPTVVPWDLAAARISIVMRLSTDKLPHCSHIGVAAEVDRSLGCAIRSPADARTISLPIEYFLVVPA